MKKYQGIFYLLLPALVFLNIALLLKLRSLSASPALEIVNYLAYPLKVEKKELFAFLQESGFIQDGTTFHFQKETTYRPKKIILAFDEMTAGQKGFIQVFNVHDKPVACYDLSQTDDTYQINLYFSLDYLSGLDNQALDYAFKSFPTKAILYLAKVHQKKQRLKEADQQEIYQLLPEFLKKYDFIRVAKD